VGCGKQKVGLCLINAKIKKKKKKKEEWVVTVAFDIFKTGKDQSLPLQQLNSCYECVQSPH